MRGVVANHLLASRRCPAVPKTPDDETGLLVLKSLLVELEQEL